MVHKKNLQSGLTLVDVVIGIIFLAVAFVGTTYAIRSIEEQGFTSEVLIRGTSLGNSIMEVMRSLRFDENYVEPWSNPLGPEEGNPADYDDVDDYFQGYPWTYTDYTGFTAKTRVFYVDPDVSLDDSVGTITNYKKIIVHVYHSRLIDKITITSELTP